MGRTLGFTASVIALLVLGVLAVRPAASAEDDTPAKAGIDAKTAFGRIKTLVGTWKSQISDEHQAAKKDGHEELDKGGSSVTYKLTGAGSALVETQFPGCAARNGVHLPSRRRRFANDPLLCREEPTAGQARSG